ncbi:MAG: Ig-like domain repeat protein [Terriglobales bacterium]
MDKRARRASIVVVMLLLAACLSASAASSKTAATPRTSGAQLTGACAGGASLSGWYGMLVNGGGKYLTGALLFDGNCNVSGNNITGGVPGPYITTSVAGTYGQNSDGTFTITLNLAGQSTPQTYMVGVSESGNKARGIESDGTIEATIDLQSQLTTQTSGYTTASLIGSYAASCYGNAAAELNYLTFDGNGNVSGLDDSDSAGGASSNSISGTYSVNGDGTFSGNLGGGRIFAGVIDNGVSEIEYTYALFGQGNRACVGKQYSATNLFGWYGFVVGGTAQSGGGGKYLSGSVYFNGAGQLSGANVNGGMNGQYGPTSVVGSYSLNPDNTISINMNLANQTAAQTYVVGVSESGNEAIGIESDSSAIATIDMQNQLPPSGTPAYSNASLNGTYAAFCSGSEVDLNWVTFDGNGGQIGVDAYDDGAFGDSPYIGTYSVNADGTFTGNFSGIYSIFTMTGVIDNGNSEIEFSYDQSGVGGVVACVGESTYGPVGANPVAATPSFSPAPGIYALPQTITLSDTTAGAVIHYTTDGSAPSIGSPVYSGPVAVSATASIQAIAVASGYSNSAIAAGTYFAGRNLSQTITFPTIPNQTYPAQQVSLNATASSGLPVSYAVLSGPGTLTGNILTITGVGSVTVQASQSGSTQYAAASPVSQAATVNQSTTTLVLTSTSNPSALDQPITLAATIMPQNGGQATGTVTFKDGATTLSVVAVTGNVASLSTSALAIGTHSISATYSGDANFGGSAAVPLLQVVTKAPSTATLASSLNPANSGQLVTFTATVSSPAVAPTGSVQLLNGSTVLATVALKSGVAKYSTAKLPAGSNPITAVYGGDANNSGSTSAVLNQVMLAATTTTLTSSPNPSVYGQPVLFTAKVDSSMGAPPDGETVTFKQGTTTLGTGTLSGGIATLSTTPPGVGPKPVTAVYGGDSNLTASTSKADNQVIGKAATTTALGSSLNPSNPGQPITFTATVTPQFSGTPTGLVTFYDGTKVLGTVAPSGGAANFTTAKLTAGTHSITATYNGSTYFVGSSGTLTQTVN